MFQNDPPPYITVVYDPPPYITRSWSRRERLSRERSAIAETCTAVAEIPRTYRDQCGARLHFPSAVRQQCPARHAKPRSV